ncbi:MAG: AMP-binding protein [Mycobacteriales bacterium]
MAHNLADLARAAARARPDSPALLFRDEQVTWAELDARIDRVAAGLLGLGLSAGDRVGLQLTNTPEFPAAYFGVLRAGLVCVPLNTGYTGRELSNLLDDAGARALVATESGASLVQGIRSDLPDLEHIIVGGGGPAPAGARTLGDLVAATPVSDVADALEAGEARGGEDLALLIYTSGTSGTPKGAMLTHRALLANLDQVSSIEPPVLRRDDVVLLVLPLFHIYGLNAGLGMVARHGATGVLAERFDATGTLELITRHHVTNVVGAPPMYVAWAGLPDLANTFPSVRLATSGAAPLPASVLSRLRDEAGLDIYEGYGLTETAPVVTSTLLSDLPKPNSIGRAIPGVEVMLVDEDGDEVEEDDAGELTVRGSNLFSGYWPDGEGGPDEQGWFATGDVGYADDDGDLHLVDRRKELILVSGFNVYPREVEAVLLEHPGIAQAAVVGVPDEHTGEAVRAVIVAEPGAQVSRDDVTAHCEQSLARFKCPSVIDIVAELPRSATGKVLKGALRGISAGPERADPGGRP